MSGLTCTKYVYGRVSMGTCGKPGKVGSYSARDHIVGNLQAEYIKGGWLQTSDERVFVIFDTVYCGRHAKEAGRNTLPVESLDPDDNAYNTHLALLDYEERKVKREADRKQSELDYQRDKLEDQRVTHSLKFAVKYGNETEIELVDDKTGRGVSVVRVEREGGQVIVGASNFGGWTGRGRGNPSWVARMMEALAIAQKMQAANVTVLTMGDDGEYILPE